MAALYSVTVSPFKFTCPLRLLELLRQSTFGEASLYSKSYTFTENIVLLVLCSKFSNNVYNHNNFSLTT